MSDTFNTPPLTDMKVIEIGQIAAGPFAGMLLADLGADVVKIEKPETGDGMRDWPPLRVNKTGNTYSGNFASLNRNKRSVVIDFKDSKQLNKLKKLCQEADVVIENYRPGVLKKFSLDYESLKQENPKLIYCSISGFGHIGPYAEKGAFDVTIQAISGLMSVTGEKEGDPVKSGVPVGDFVAALYGAYSIVSSFLKVKRTNKGAYIDCSMLGGLLGISALQTSEYYGTGESPKRLGTAHPRNAPYQGYHAKDRPFVVAAGNDGLWKKVCYICGVPELINDKRFINQSLRAKNQEELNEILKPIFLKKTSKEWLKKFDEKGIPCAPINSFEEVLQDTHVKEMNIINETKLPNGIRTNDIGFPVKISGFEYKIFKYAPKLGEHNQEVFSEWFEESD